MKHRKSKREVWIPPVALASAILFLWCFPSVWYTRGAKVKVSWFAERESIPGWSHIEVPIGHSAEKVLVADRIVSGEFRNSEGMLVRVFSAKRHRENPNEIGLFIHTPDRCWTEGGWKLEMSVPDSLELTLHGTSIPFERRIFEIKGQRELVYFAGLVSGRGLPYRLDHHQSIATRAGLASLTQALDPHFWHRLWDSFKSRTQLQGPKHFLRISTPIEGRDLTECDEMLKGFLPQWLVSGDYYEEIHRAVVESKQRIPR